MADKANAEVEFELRKLYFIYSSVIENHLWPREDLRFSELVYSLISTISKSQDDLREAVDFLDDLNLLEVQKLASIDIINGEINLESTHAKKIADVLLDFQFSSDEIKKSILAIHELATGLVSNFGGKIQKYLRKYGQLMINDISHNFAFSKLSEKDVKFAFTFWLQNVLNMPISLDDSDVQEFCSKFGIDSSKLLEHADNLDINVAIVDDLIKHWKYSTQTDES